jgi:PAS domain S-box-containing protein
MLDAAPDAIVGVDRDGLIVLANIQTEALFGYERSDLLGQHIEILVPDRVKGVHPHHLESYFDHPRTRLNSTGLELSGRRSDGTEFPAEISLSTIETSHGTLAMAAIRDTTTKKLVEAEALMAHEEADRANEAKSKFLSRVSHELRTPLNAILGFGQLLKLDSLSPNQSDAVDQILSGGNHLLGLINEVLDIGQTESGMMAVSSPEPVDFGFLVDEAIQLVQPIAARRGVTFVVRPKTSGLRVLADPQRLKQVFLNLLSNAIKYNHEGGEISISVDCSEPTCRATFTDTGDGISPEHMARLFTPFDRAGAEFSGIEGSGLGLAVSKSLVQQMGGDIGVESTLGSGSTFWVELPRTDKPIEEPVGAGRAANPRKEHAQRTVLYIEDNLSNLRLVRGILAHRLFVNLLSGMDGASGLDLARRRQPDLILLDLHLPDMTGEQALDELAADARTCEIPVVVISADASSGTARRLLEAGARMFVTKPIDVAAFLNTLDEVLV